MEIEEWVGQKFSEIDNDVHRTRPSPHQSIFKYVDLKTKTSWDYLNRTFNELELVGTSPQGLNDPFESVPCEFDDLTPDIIAKSIGYNGLMQRLRKELSTPKEVFSDLELYRIQARECLDRLQKYMRIISFCERSDSSLLWSHYANSYQGACLHFFGRGFRSQGLRIGKVFYSNNRPPYPLSLALTVDKYKSYQTSAFSQSESDKILFFSKALDWAYENEVRIIYNSNSVKKFTFSEDGLASVILGPRITSENENRIRRMVAESKFSHIPIRKASLSTNSFSVEIRDT